MSIIKLRRGRISTMKNVKPNIVLAAGEIFAEVPDTGVGTGKGRLVMGDGVTTYSNLPSFIESTDNNFVGTISDWSNLSTAEKAKFSTVDLTDEFGGSGVTIDNTPTENSNNVVKSGGVYSALSNKESAPTILTQTLSANATTITFTDNSIGNNSRIRVYSNPFVLGLFTDMTQSGTTVTLTCNAQSSAISIILEIYN